MFIISYIVGIKLPLPIIALGPHINIFHRSLLNPFNNDAALRKHFSGSFRRNQYQAKVALSDSKSALVSTHQLHQQQHPYPQPQPLLEQDRLKSLALAPKRTMDARFNKPVHGNPPNKDTKKPTRSSTKSSRPTHFICFPLVTPTSIPQLAASLARFREVTTETPELRMRRRWAQKQQQRMKERQSGEGDEKETVVTDREYEGDAATETTTTTAAAAAVAEESAEDALKILPDVVHRPPGTFHLTIGVMDLSEEGKLERAVAVLRNMKVGELLGDVEREIGYECPSISTVTVGNDVEDRTSEEVKEEQRFSQYRKVLCRNDNVDGSGDMGEKSLDKQQHQHHHEATTSTTTPALHAHKSNDTEEASTATSHDQSHPHNKIVLSLTKPISPPPLSPKPSPITTSPPIIITLSSLRVFSAPRKARVFYAPPSDPSSRLLPLAKKILAIFKSEGLVADEEHKGEGGGGKGRELTLHATVANMRYAKDVRQQGGGGGGRGKGKGKKDFRMVGVDARGVLDFFNVGHDMTGITGEAGAEEGARTTGAGEEQEDGGCVWAKDILIDKVWICKMGAETSDDPVLGMGYPPVKTRGGVLAEVEFGSETM